MSNAAKIAVESDSLLVHTNKNTNKNVKREREQKTTTNLGFEVGAFAVAGVHELARLFVAVLDVIGATAPLPVAVRRDTCTQPSPFSSSFFLSFFLPLFFFWFFFSCVSFSFDTQNARPTITGSEGVP